MTPPSPTIYVVDDDDAVRGALAALLGSVRLGCETFATAEDFLAVATPDMRGCLLLDVRMPGMSGLELQRLLRDRGIALPVVIITGHGDVPMAVRALKAGASDFVEKPFNDNLLVDRVLEALKLDDERRQAAASADSVNRRLAQLTPRERQVMERILAGKLNKMIADELAISMRTVEVHRANVFEKMGVRTAVELAQLLASRR